MQVKHSKSGLTKEIAWRSFGRAVKFERAKFCIVFRVWQNPDRRKLRDGTCTLTTAQQINEDSEKGQLQVSEEASEGERERTGERRIGSRYRERADERKRATGKENWSQDLRRKNQATKSTGWMPWHHTPKKDAASCEKLRGAASRH